MNMFPMFLAMKDRSVIIVGGGEQAAQKCRLILKTTARITVLADTLDPELASHEREGLITLLPLQTPAEIFADAALVFIATGCKGADSAWARLAKEKNAVVNVVDYPELCDAYTPSIVDRSPVVVAIGTEGAAPVLGRQIKTQIEQILEPRLGQLARICGSLRDEVAQRIPTTSRREFWRWVFNGSPRQLHASGSERDAIAAIKTAIQCGTPPEAGVCSRHYEILANGETPDLISVKDVKHLQEADIIYFDNPQLTPVLEYARRDAARRYFEADHHRKTVGIEAASQGLNVVVIHQQDTDRGLLN